MREKMSKQPPPKPTASTIGPCPTVIQISRTPRHWKFTQHLRATRPPHELKEIVLPVPSNQIKVTFIIILPFNLVHLCFFSCFTQKLKENVGGLLGGGGGGKGYVAPPPPPALKLFGGLAPLPSLFLRL